MTPKEALGKPPPRCKAILLCDLVIVDVATRKTSLIGIFDRFTAPQFPTAVGPFYAYVQMVEGIGRYEIVVEAHDLSDGRVIGRLPPMPLDFPNRMSKANLIIPAPPLPLPHPGFYDFVVFADGQEIDRQKFEAALLPPRPPPGKAP
jgi:hypothetical protein